MLTPEQLDGIRARAEEIARPITEYLLEDIARRVSEAGQLTSTASYQIWQAQQFGMSQQEIKKELKRLLNVSSKKIEELLTQSAKVGYDFDISHLPTAEAIPFDENESLQQIVNAAVQQAQGDFTNLTQTLGMVDPYGHPQPLQDAYRKCMDFAFEQVFTGATDYNNAIRRATKNLADQGVRVIDYESGVHRSIEAATRGNIMGGLGIMQEQISQQNHDSFGADGWEISAHSASAPDHEPIQGKQYTDAEYESLNNSLVRRIGTLNCGHAAFPIVIGVSEPQYTDEELNQMREENAKGIDYQGRHYSTYEATQMQRKIERTIRKQKNRILVDEATGDADKLQTDQIRLRRLNEEYKRFSKTADLPLQRERAQVVGFGVKQASDANSAYKRVAKAANSMYNIGSEEQNVAAYMRDLPLRKRIQSGEFPLDIHKGRQNKHVVGTQEYEQYVKQLQKNGKHGPSRITISTEEMQDLIETYKGTGILQRDKHGQWRNSELITIHPDKIGIAVNDRTGAEADTSVFCIHYSKDGVHISPDYPSKKGAKCKK